MSFEPLRITMTLGSSVYATGQPLHLDALLAFDRVRHEPGASHGPHLVAWEPSTEEEVSLPLARMEDGAGNWWYRASAVELVGGARSRQFWAKRFDRDHLAELAMGKATQVVTTLGPLKDMKVPVETVFLPQVVWFAVGNRGRVYRGLKRLRFLGKKAGQGYGAITALSVEVVEASDLDWKREDGRPARNLPTAWARERGLLVEGEISAPLRPPYWRKGKMVTCRVAR